MTLTSFKLFLIGFGLFVAGFAVAWIAKSCQKQPEPQTHTVTLPPEYIYDTVTLTKNIIKPVPCYRIVDSAAVYAAIKAKTPRELDALYLAYYAENSYDTVVSDDTSAFIRLRARTWQNQLELMGVDFINRRATAINNTVNTTVVNDCKTRFYLGAQFNYLMKADKFPLSFGVAASLVLKKHLMFGASYDPFNSVIGANISYRLGK